MEYIDLRSDTVTVPTPSMKEAAISALLGDDGYREDPTVIELEERAASLLGKEAALFVPTGHFGNQLSIFTHCKKGQEVILADECHIIQWEGGAVTATISQVQLRTLTSNKGTLDPKEIEETIRKDAGDPHCPSTGLICIENAFSNGKVVALDNFRQIREVADKYNIPVHLDGARLFNAATTLNVPAKEIAQYADSVMFCLSKGLCAPLGSLLVSTKEFIARARNNRKTLGGSLRQAGMIAGAGLVALSEMVPQLKDDHKIAKLLANELNGLGGVVKVRLEDVDINMIFFTIEDDRVVDAEIREYFLKNGIKIGGRNNKVMRFVVHHYIREEQVKKIVQTMKDFLELTQAKK